VALVQLRLVRISRPEYVPIFMTNSLPGACMSPVGPMSQEKKKELKKILQQMGLLC
jgi:hypothetical protein